MTLRDLIDRLRRLAGSLGEYRRRVREAVAGETARLVADAVRDVLAAALGGRPEPAEPGWARPARRHRGWDDDEPDWRDDEAEPYAARSAMTAEPRLPAAAAVALAVSRWWSGRRPAWVGLGLGALAAAAALFGGPALQAAAGLAAAAATAFA